MSRLPEKGDPVIVKAGYRGWLVGTYCYAEEYLDSENELCVVHRVDVWIESGELKTVMCYGLENLRRLEKFDD